MAVKQSEVIHELNSNRLFKLLDSVVLFMLLGHISFVGLFYFLERPEMILLNACVSVPALLLALIFIRKRLFPRLRLILPYAELIFHSIVASIVLGWESGFFLYLVAGIVLTQIYPWKQWVKVLISSMLVLVIACLYAFAFRGSNEFDDFYEQVLFLINLAGTVAYMTYFIFFQMRLSSELEGSLAESNLELETGKKEIEHAHTEIQDSIAYAKRIQTALLPTSELLTNLFQSSFLLYLPRDVIAGDFYWAGEYDGIKIVAVADCTGHGVPGAMVSVVCINALKRSVNEFKLRDPGEILTKTRELVVEQFGSASEDIHDGMDVVLIAIKEDKLLFSGAHNSLYVVRQKELIEVKGDKQPVGKYISQEPFNTVTFILQKNDFLVLSSDGFPDQFGGPKGKKFKSSNFKELLLKSSDLNLDKRMQFIHDAFISWKGAHEQVDDITVLGIEIA